MVLITDGGDTISKVDYKEALRAAEEAEAIVYSIIIVPIESSAGRETGGEHALIQLSEDTGGKYYYATSIAQLDEAFRKISDELRTQYLLAYYPSQRTSFSEFRRIEVKVTRRAGRVGLPCAPSRGILHRKVRVLTRNQQSQLGPCYVGPQKHCNTAVNKTLNLGRWVN